MKDTQIIKYKGFAMKVFYNSVKPNACSLMPYNCWCGYCKFNYKGKPGIMYSPLNDSITSITEAVSAMKPEFIKSIDKFLKND